MLRRTLFLPLFALLAAPALVHAAELGEARVSSHVGQQLVADIELTMLDDAASPVAVRLASPEVYNGAGIAMPPVLSTLNLSVMRRDGRQFLHVTSLRPVDSEHLHLYLELTDKGQRAVRLATLWLTPDPNPAPLAAAAPVPAPAPALAPAPAQAPVPAHARAEARPAALPVSPAPRTPAPRRAAVAAHEAATPKPEPAKSTPRTELPPPLPIHKPEAAPAASCAPAPEAKACIALGYKNAELKEQLGQLEDKVKVLQVALGEAPAKAAAGAAPVPPAEAPPAPPAGPRPIRAIKPLVPKKPKAPPPEEGLPWGWIGAGLGLLGLGGAAAVVLRRRKGSANVDIPPAPGVLERLKERFAARTKTTAEAAQEAAEPTLE